MSLHVVTVGAGPRVVLVHGSATDHATWSIQLASAALRERFELVAYDRRGLGASAAAPGALPTVEDHADDLAALIEGRAATDVPLPPVGPVIAVGSSFGAACVLACARRRPELFRALVLCEPPLAPDDEAPPAPAGFVDGLERLAAERGGPAAAEAFLRTVLGDAAFDRMPRAFVARATAQWPQILADCRALERHRPAYRSLAALDVPVLLLGGERSAGYFAATLAALAAALPRARRATLAGAGHMMHAEAPRVFAEHLSAVDAAAGGRAAT